MARPKKNPNKVKWTGFPISEADRKTIKTAIDQTHPIMVAIETEKGSLKDIYDEMNEKFGMPRRVFNFLVKCAYYGNQDVTFEKNEELKEAWESYENVKS